MKRFSSGITQLDKYLGGGFRPGTTTVIIGATGVGKTQLGIHFANAGHRQEGERGALVDLSSRGDTQSHAAYAQRLCDWKVSSSLISELATASESVPGKAAIGNLLHGILEPSEGMPEFIEQGAVPEKGLRHFNRMFSATVGFLYHHFVRGTRRVVFDGLPPVDAQHHSPAYQMLDLIQARVIKQSAEWVARELYRQRYRHREHEVASASYDFEAIAGLVLCTSQHAMLEQLIETPLLPNDIAAEANTLIYMGRVRIGNRLERAMYIAKHRGSECHDEFIPFSINDQGLQLS